MQYLCTFSHEYSGYRTIDIIRRKHEAQKAFIIFSVYFERQSDCSIKMLDTDRGGDFTVMDEYVADWWIRLEYSAAYTPQHNVVAEHLNRTLLEMERELLSHSGSPRKFWAEEVSCAVNIRNFLSSNARP